MTTATIDLRRLLPGHEAQEDACTTTIQQQIAALDGVLATRFINTGVARFEVDYDPRLLDGAQLERGAERAGQAARQRYAHEEFRLQGLHCVDCADKIATITGKLDGVLASSANYATEKLQVAFDRSAFSTQRLQREVESLGYRALPAGPPTRRERRHDQEHDHDHEHQQVQQGGRRWPVPTDLLLSGVAGLMLITGFVLQRLGAPTLAWLLPYLTAYAAGGWLATNHAVRAALRGRFDIDILMVTAALGAAALGAWAEGALLLFLFSLGHALERLAMNRARSAIRALADLTPTVARVVRDGREVELPVSELQIGDHVIVRAGERIPADGQVIKGASMVDQAPITGESVPVLKEAGADTFAGTINGSGALEILTTKDPEDTTLARVVKAVESAQSAKAPSHRFTDRFQRILTPIILGITLLVIVVPPLFGVEFSTSFMRAMTLLVASSPCALALATPSAVLSGIARAARSGVLVKGGVYLENAGMAKVVVFDKTGTLTRGTPSVTNVVGGDRLDESTLLRLSAAVESRSGHPLAAAVLRESETRGLRTGAVEEFTETVGHGAAGVTEGQRVVVGNRKLMSAEGAELPTALEAAASRMEQDGKTVVFVATSAQGSMRVDGLIALRDEPRPEAKATVAALKNLGIQKVVMLSGDNPRVANALGRELGIDEVAAGLLPEEKAVAIKELQRRYGHVVMVGDGVNDAPALAAADVGVAMGGAGSDVALETADVALMADDLSKLPYAVALSRASRRMIVQNLVISLGVIILLVPSALLGLASIGIAVVIHESSTLVVVVNALRLLGFKGGPSTEAVAA